MSSSVGTQIAQTAAQGLQASSRWHLFNRQDKNAEAAAVALDHVALQGESLPEFSRGLRTLRSLEEGVSPEARLSLQRTLLVNLAHNGASHAAANTFPILSVLYHLLNSSNLGTDEDRHDILNRATSILEGETSKSSSPVSRLANQLKNTGLMTRLSLVEEGVYLSDDHEAGDDAIQYLDRVDYLDRPVMHRFLVDNLRTLRPDAEGQAAAQFLDGLSRVNQDDECHLGALEVAFSMFSRGSSAQEIAAEVRSCDLTDQARAVVDELEQSLRPQLELDFASEPQQLPLFK